MSGVSPPLLVLLLGDPVAHSLSPIIHNAAFSAAGIRATYRTARVPPAALEAALQGLRAEGVLGANITIPHKESAARLVDHLDSTSERLRAVNTVVSQQGELRGYNTDVTGFLKPLISRGTTLRRALVLGSGGAARAVVWGLCSMQPAPHVIVAGRNRDRLDRLVCDVCGGEDGSAHVSLAPWTEAAAAARSADLIVNATPLGMSPTSGDSPLPEMPFTSEQTVYDLVYAPLRTRLLADAQRCGAQTISGIEMLVGQAAAAFELWTGTAMPIRPVDDALRRHLGSPLHLTRLV